MLWEMDISIISGQLALLHVKLEPGDGFEVYGGTSEDGLRVERQSESEWLVTMDEQDVAGRPLVRYNLYARQVASGREWAILGGKVMVSQRTATVPGDKLAPVEYFVTVPVLENTVDLTGTALVTGIVGPRGYSAYDIAVMEGFEGSEAEWLEYMRQKTATLAVEQVTPLVERAERAALEAETEKQSAAQQVLTARQFASKAEDNATEAETQATQAEDSRIQAVRAADRASSEAAKAEQEKQAAAGHAAEAQEQAENAETYMHTAASNAERAAEHRKAAAEEVTKAAAEVDKAAQERQAAAGHAGAAGQSAAEAQAAQTEAEQAKQDALKAQSKAEQEASKAERHAELLGDAAMQSGDNSFAGNNDHAGTEIFNGAVALNDAVAFPGGTTTAAEMAAGYFYARRYWELATDIAGLFKEQKIDALPKDADGLVKLSFPNATKGKEAFSKCRCATGVSIELPKVTTQADFTGIICNLNNNGGNNYYHYTTLKLSLPAMSHVSLQYSNGGVRLWSAKLIIDAPKATSFYAGARHGSCYGNLPLVKEVRCQNEYYLPEPAGGWKWFIALPSLETGAFGYPNADGLKFRLSKESVFCILGTIPTWEDGAAHPLSLNILPALANNADFQTQLAAALGAQNEDGSFKGALVREYGENGTSGEDELGMFTDSYVADKGWQITVTYA